MIKNSKNKYYILTFVSFFFWLPSLLIGHAGDDWITAAAKTKIVAPSNLWRPFENIYYVILTKLGITSYANIAILNHGLVGIGYILSVLLLYKIIKENINEKYAFLTALIYSTSAANSATVLSLDSGIQIYSTLVGLIAIYFAVSPNQKLKTYLFLFLAVLIAPFIKESGIVWGVAAIIIYVQHAVSGEIELDKRRLKTYFFIAAICIIVYAIIRIYLTREIGLQGRYVVDLSLSSILRSLIILIGFSAAQLDTIDLFTKNHLTGSFVLTLIFTISFWSQFVFNICNSHRRFNLKMVMLSIMFIVCITSPHIVFSHPSEMYANPTIAGIVISISYYLKDIRKEKIFILFVVLWIIFGVYIHQKKATNMYFASQLGREANRNIQTILSLVREKEIFIKCQKGKGNYSIYVMDTALATLCGKSAFMTNDIDKKYVILDNVTEKQLRKHSPLLTIDGNDVMLNY